MCVDSTRHARTCLRAAAGFSRSAFTCTQRTPPPPIGRSRRWIVTPLLPFTCTLHTLHLQHHLPIPLPYTCAFPRCTHTFFVGFGFCRCCATTAHAFARCSDVAVYTRLLPLPFFVDFCVLFALSYTFWMRLHTRHAIFAHYVVRPHRGCRIVAFTRVCRLRSLHCMRTAVPRGFAVYPFAPVAFVTVLRQFTATRTHTFAFVPACRAVTTRCHARCRMLFLYALPRTDFKFSLRLDTRCLRLPAIVTHFVRVLHATNVLPSAYRCLTYRVSFTHTTLRLLPHSAAFCAHLLPAAFCRPPCVAVRCVTVAFCAYASFAPHPRLVCG